MVKNSAFLFIKPHANTEATQKLMREGLAKEGITVLTEGLLTAKEIDEKMLIDKHYYAIASKATLLQPKELNVPAEKFKAQFGLGWQEALDKGVVYNAKDAGAKLGLDATGLDKVWAAAKKAKKLVKFGGGFYCGLIDTVPGFEPLYTFNGFFMEMRSKYVAPGASIYYYSVEWDAKKMSWEDFRDNILGSTDPTTAPEGSLRGQVLKNWEALGLQYVPNVGDNGVHGSASPFEGMCERLNWLGASMKNDEFAQALMGAGVPAKTIENWSVDPQVTYGYSGMPIKGSLFDALENTNVDECVARATMINAGLVSKKSLETSKQSSSSIEQKPAQDKCCPPKPKPTPTEPKAQSSNMIPLLTAFAAGIGGALMYVQMTRPCKK